MLSVSVLQSLAFPRGRTPVPNRSKVPARPQTSAREKYDLRFAKAHLSAGQGERAAERLNVFALVGGD
jgi:hypothetical protein